MSLHAYLQSRELDGLGFSFDALIMAAMRQADSWNVEKLKAAFPDIWADLYARYHAPGGRLPFDDPAPEEP